MHRITISHVPMAMSNNKISLLWKSHALQKPCERETIPNSRMQLNSKHFSTSLHSDAISFVQRQIVCKTVKQNRMKHDDKNFRDFSTKKEERIFCLLSSWRLSRGGVMLTRQEGAETRKVTRKRWKKEMGGEVAWKWAHQYAKCKSREGARIAPCALHLPDGQPYYFAVQPPKLLGNHGCYTANLFSCRAHTVSFHFTPFLCIDCAVNT